MSPREEELQIEIERLKCWLGKIQTEAWKGATPAELEGLAETALRHGNAAAQTDWRHLPDWAPLGVWPPKAGCPSTTANQDVSD